MDASWVTRLVPVQPGELVSEGMEGAVQLIQNRTAILIFLE
jgi:hypothetical protein